MANSADVSSRLMFRRLNLGSTASILTGILSKAEWVEAAKLDLYAELRSEERIESRFAFCLVSSMISRANEDLNIVRISELKIKINYSLSAKRRFSHKIVHIKILFHTVFKSHMLMEEHTELLWFRYVTNCEEFI